MDIYKTVFNIICIKNVINDILYEEIPWISVLFYIYYIHPYQRMFYELLMIRYAENTIGTGFHRRLDIQQLHYHSF